jgi:hypothetical protein
MVKRHEQPQERNKSVKKTMHSSYGLRGNKDVQSIDKVIQNEPASLNSRFLTQGFHIVTYNLALFLGCSRLKKKHICNQKGGKLSRFSNHVMKDFLFKRETQGARRQLSKDFVTTS